MFRKEPEIIMCVRCGNIYWIKDAEVVGKYMSHQRIDVPEEWCNAEDARELMETDYYIALKKGLARTKKEEKLTAATNSRPKITPPELFCMRPREFKSQKRYPHSNNPAARARL